MSFYGQVKSDSGYAVARGTELLFDPWLETGKINPKVSVVAWQEPIHRVEFRFQLPKIADGKTVRGGVRIYSGLLLIGEVNFSIQVKSGAPLVGGPDVRTRTAMYRKIFASYAHTDTDIVESLRTHVETIGDRYLIDVRDLRSGEQWSERLEEMIREADIFQLFWSTNSMRSEFVRQEWEYALRLDRELFVRPVHWEVPLPEDAEQGLPPDQLRAIHFATLPPWPSQDEHDPAVVSPRPITAPPPVSPGGEWRPPRDMRGRYIRRSPWPTIIGVVVAALLILTLLSYL